MKGLKRKHGNVSMLEAPVAQEVSMPRCQSSLHPHLHSHFHWCCCHCSCSLSCHCALARNIKVERWWNREWHILVSPCHCHCSLDTYCCSRCTFLHLGSCLLVFPVLTSLGRVVSTTVIFASTDHCCCWCSCCCLSPKSANTNSK